MLICLSSGGWVWAEWLMVLPMPGLLAVISSGVWGSWLNSVRFQAELCSPLVCGKITAAPPYSSPGPCIGLQFDQHMGVSVF